MILFFCGLHPTNCHTQFEKEDQSGDTITVRSLPQTSILGIKQLPPDAFLIGMVDSSTYYSDLLITNKLELLIQNEALNYPQIERIKLILTTPNRDTLGTEYTLRISNFLEELRFKYSIPKYVEAIRKIGKLIDANMNHLL